MFINGAPFISIIDMGATHSFISHDCVIKLNLVMYLMKGSIVNDTPINDYVLLHWFVLIVPYPFMVKILELT